MINISKLYCEQNTYGDALRYGHPSEMAIDIPKTAKERRPVVVWNITRRCNLHCSHCYTDSEDRIYDGELSTEEAMEVIKDLATFQIPALLFSGGEPLLREDIFELASFAKSLGIRPVLSTNGSLITLDIAKKLHEAGFIYIGISLDGIGEKNDRFRGKKGAFTDTMAGFRNCKQVNQRVGLRLTLTKHNYTDLEEIFDLIEEEDIDRACFYHLVYSGRGSDMICDDLSHQETRKAMDIILKRTRLFHQKGLNKDILTVDNHVDGVYLYLKLLEEDQKQAERIYQFLKWNGGGLYSSGVGIGNIDTQGNVHPDQFWSHYTLGNVRHRKFSEIWTDTADPLMVGLRDRKKLLKGRCSRCKWIDLCGGSFRVRADIIYNDPWAEDPACYLTEEEITSFTRSTI